MDKYTYRFYSEQLENDWQSVVKNSSDSWVFHDMGLCQFLAKSMSAKNISLLIYNVNYPEPVAICPLFLHTQRSAQFYRPNKLAAESFCESGPAIIDTLNQKNRREVIRYIGNVLIAIVKKEKIKVCRIASANLSQFCLSPNNVYTNPWHEMRDNWQNKTNPYYYIDLTKSEESLKQSMTITPRSIINKLEKEKSYSIRKADINDLDIIYNLFAETSQRAGLPFHQKDNFEWFLSFKYAEHYLVFSGEVPACAVRIYKYKDTAYYAAGFTANTFVKSDINTYALWRCMMEAKKQNVAHFNFGFEEFGPIGTKAYNIAKFKSNFGGILRYQFASVYERENTIKKALRKLLEMF